MKKLTILLALCIMLTSVAACSSKPTKVEDGEKPADSEISGGGNDKNNENDVNNESGDGNNETENENTEGDVLPTPDVTPNPDIELDDTPVPVEKGISGKVTEASLNIRESATTKSKSLGTVERGKELLITKLQGVDSVLWGYMGEGYVCLDYVSFDIDGNGTMIYGTVSTDNLSAREAPHVFCEIEENLTKDTRLEISAFACSGTAIWGLTSSGWVCLNYVTLDQGVEVVEGQNAEVLDPFYLAPDYKETKPKDEGSVAPVAESIIGTWEFVTLTGFYSTIHEEYFSAVKGYITFNGDGSFLCGYDECISTLYSEETSVKSWDVSEEGTAAVGGNYEITENGIVLNYTYVKETAGDELVTDFSKTVTLQVTQSEDILFVKNPKDFVYTIESNLVEITHSAFYRGYNGNLLEKVYPGTYN